MCFRRRSGARAVPREKGRYQFLHPSYAYLEFVEKLIVLSSQLPRQLVPGMSYAFTGQEACLALSHLCPFVRTSLYYSAAALASCYDPEVHRDNCAHSSTWLPQKLKTMHFHRLKKAYLVCNVRTILLVPSTVLPVAVVPKAVVLVGPGIVILRVSCWLP